MSLKYLNVLLGPWFLSFVLNNDQCFLYQPRKYMYCFETFIQESSRYHIYSYKLRDRVRDGNWFYNCESMMIVQWTTTERSVNLCHILWWWMLIWQVQTANFCDMHVWTILYVSSCMCMSRLGTRSYFNFLRICMYANWQWLGWVGQIDMCELNKNMAFLHILGNYWCSEQQYIR